MDMERLKNPYDGQARLWSVWDQLEELVAFVVAVGLLPVVGPLRSLSRIGHHWRLAGLGDEAATTRQQLKLASGTSLDFLQTHLSRLRQLHEEYLTTPWQSLAEAEAGYRLLLAAQAALLSEAQVTVSRLSSAR